MDGLGQSLPVAGYHGGVSCQEPGAARWVHRISLLIVGPRIQAAAGLGLTAERRARLDAAW